MSLCLKAYRDESMVFWEILLLSWSVIYLSLLFCYSFKMENSDYIPADFLLD